MKTLSIIIEKEELIKELEKAAAYAGFKTESADPDATFERVSLIEEDGDLLERYWHEACGFVAGSLKDFIAEAGFGEERLELVLELSGSFDMALGPAVREGLFSWMCALVGARWFRLTLPEKSGDWDALSSRFEAGLISKLYHRTKPIRKCNQ